MNIKTRAQFDAIAETWYKRTHWLRLYWLDESKDDKKRVKAGQLWTVMFTRMTHVIMPMCTKLNQKAQNNTSFEPGGVVGISENFDINKFKNYK